MADNSNDIKYYKEKLEKAIEDGVELFKYYKEISKEFQKLQKNLMNNTDLKNKINKIVERRKGIYKRKLNKKLSESDIKLSNLLNAELAKEEELLKSNQYKQKHNKITEFSLVDSEKIFLKEKEKIRKEKKRILSRIKIALSQLKKKVGENDYNKLIKEILGSSYELSDNKQIRFKTLMHHLESGEISNEVSKTTKKIEELMTIGNIVNRKKRMEIGIKQKEIDILLKEFDKIMEKLKKIAAAKFPNKNITNDDIESLLGIKFSKENSPEFKKMISKLRSNLRTLKYDIQIKMQELKKLQASS